MRSILIGALLWCPLLLASCAWSDFKALDPAPPSLTENETYQGATDVSRLMSALKEMRQEYDERWKGSTRIAVHSQLPLVGLAAGAVSVISYATGPAQANFLAGLGIGTGLYEGGRRLYSPASKAEAYQKASAALFCIEEKSTKLRTQYDLKTLSDAYDAIAKIIPGANAAIVTNGGSTDPVVVAARESVARARDAAIAAQALALAEINAKANAFAIIKQGMLRVDTQLHTLFEPANLTTEELISSFTDAVQRETALGQNRNKAAEFRAESLNLAATGKQFAAERSTISAAIAALDPEERKARGITLLAVPNTDQLNQYADALRDQTKVITTDGARPGLAEAEAATMKCSVI